MSCLERPQGSGPIPVKTPKRRSAHAPKRPRAVAPSRSHALTLSRLLLLLAATLLLAACAGSRQPEATSWVEAKLAAMSLEEKVGQMMAREYSARFYPETAGGFNALLDEVREGKVGSVVFFRWGSDAGDPYAVARTLNRLQAAAPLPLLAMVDNEWGMSMRVNATTDFLQNMAVGATRSEDYAYQMGRITAIEADALGAHVGFAPVLDVNNNPDNIIINTRSFGEDPELVGRLGAAYIRGMQENGQIATAKHFPGHGDTDVDSHLGLPTIDASRERLSEVELAPFRAAVEAGVKGIMVAHITYSAFPEMEGRPATLDPYFIQEVLRKEMGFTGLVITDAMGMQGIADHFWSGEAAVMAINAGVDVLLMNPHFDITFDFVVRAAREGRIPMSRIDEAVRRILQAKFEAGLYRAPVVEQETLEATLGIPAHEKVAADIARDAVTLLRDDRDVLPLAAEKLDSVLVVAVTDRSDGSGYAATLAGAVRQRVPNVRTGFIDARSHERDIQKLLAQTDSVDAVVMGMFVTWGSYKGSVTLSDTTVTLLKELIATDLPMAVGAFGSPYVVRLVPDVPSYLCAYGTGSLAVRAGVAAMFGETPVKGRLPVSIPGLFDAGAGMDQPVRNMTLVRAISDDILEPAYAVLDSAIADSVFPGAQVAVVRDGKLIASRSFGRQSYDPASSAVDAETIYDLASVTKVAATTVVAMELEERGLIRLDIPVKSYLPEFSGGMKDSVTLRHLLTHSGGLHWWVDLWNQATDRAGALDYIYNRPLSYAPGDTMIYSDLGLILMGTVLEHVTGRPLDELAERYYYRPLGMTNTMYNPAAALLPRIAPTEIGGSMNRGLIHGAVHDENAFFLGGVAPHAGLFSTAEDLAVLAQMLINGGIYNHRRYLTPETIRKWTARQHIPEGTERGLGWDPPSEHGSSAGDFFSDGSFGHLGFTGTSMWIDPNRRIAVILLSNRVHPTRERGGMYQVRRQFHNAAMHALVKSAMMDDLPRVKMAE